MAQTKAELGMGVGALAWHIAVAGHESSCDVTSFHGCGCSLSNYNLISVSAFVFVAFALSDSVSVSVAVVSLWLLLLLLLHRVARCLYSPRS